MIIYDKNDKYLVIPTGLGNLNTGVTDGDVDPCEGLYENGYEDGYDTGFDEGKTEGTAEGYENGYNTGNAEGYQNGYTAGNTEGYQTGKTEGVAEYKNSLEPLTATENGTYLGIYKNVYVEVPQAGKKYMDGTVDVDGLAVIGWDIESIQMLQDNTNFYAWQNEQWEVDDYSRGLYGVLNASNTDDYDQDNSPKFCPYFDTSNVTNMHEMFYYYYKTLGFPCFDTSNVTDMSSMFVSCQALTTIPQLDTSNVTNMREMFASCSSLTTLPQLNTSKVTDMSYMVYNCKSLTAIPQLDTSNVTNMSCMFRDCSKFTTIPQLDTRNVTNMSLMFYNSYSLTTIPQLNTSNVTDMSSMFYGCNYLTSLPELDCTNVTNMSDFFGGYSNYYSLTEIGGFINLKANLNLSRCPNLTYDSCKNVLNTLYMFARNNEVPNSNQGKLKVHANFKNAFGESEWDSIMDLMTSNFGWTIIVE